MGRCDEANLHGNHGNESGSCELRHLYLSVARDRLCEAKHHWDHYGDGTVTRGLSNMRISS
jgi:hypothetical protein